MKIILVLLVAACAAGAQTTSIRPDGLGGYNVYENNRRSATVRPNQIMGGYDIKSVRPVQRPQTPLQLAPTPGGSQVFIPARPVAPRPILQLAPAPIYRPMVTAGPALPWVPMPEDKKDTEARLRALKMAQAEEDFKASQIKFAGAPSTNSVSK